MLVELRKKHAAAKIIKMVVGKPGITIPTRPSNTKKSPAAKYKDFIIILFSNKILI
tara:strand:+ start:661 stop:828 length:168 start_codon:yes stop_codon:yes gene_type:complete